MLIIEECCLRHVPYEILDKIPTENDWDYPIPFIRIDKKDKRAWILVDNKDAKGTWIPFGGAQDAIEKIITSCGQIIPQAGVIEFIKGDGITFECESNKLKFGLQIPILAKYGGTGYTEYNLGDLLVGNIDGTLRKIPKGENGQVVAVKEDGNLGYIDVVKKLTCDGSESVTENALTRWNADGSCLKDSKTIQDDQGNTTTTSTIDGELKELLENLSSNDAATVIYHLRSLVKTMIRQEIKEKQIWDTYIDNTSKSYIVRGQNLEDGTVAQDFFQITRRGAVKNLNQPQGLIILENSTRDVTGSNNWYRLGTTETWTVIFDNYKIFTSLGGSSANPLKALLNEGGSFQFKVGIHVKNRAVPANQTFFQFRILTKGREYFSFGNTAAGLSDGYLSDNIGVIADINDELYFELWGGIADPTQTIFIIGTKWPILHTGIFYYLMG